MQLLKEDDLSALLTDLQEAEVGDSSSLLEGELVGQLVDTYREGGDKPLVAQILLTAGDRDKAVFAQLLDLDILPTLMEDAIREEDESIRLFAVILATHMIKSDHFGQGHFAYLSDTFLQEVFEVFGGDPESDIFVATLQLLLWINYKFTDRNDNPVMGIFNGHKHTNYLIEDMIKAINKGDAHVTIPGLKMVEDIFSRPETSGIIYQNDIKIIFDVIERELNSLEDRREALQAYLRCLKTLYGCGDVDGKYRSSDFRRVLEEIFDAGQSTDADDDTKAAGVMAENILTEYVSLFED